MINVVYIQTTLELGISYAFIQSLVTKCLVPFSKRILHYKNILTSTSFEHIQYNE